jgi:nucleoid DNA-binding protein
MTKKDLIAAMADAAGITKTASAAAYEAFVDLITSELKGRNNVTLTGFGTFKVSHRAARVGVNPRDTSQKIQIPAMYCPTFKAGKTLKDAVKAG